MSAELKAEVNNCVVFTNFTTHLGKQEFHTKQTKKFTFT